MSDSAPSHDHQKGSEPRNKAKVILTKGIARALDALGGGHAGVAVNAGWLVADRVMRMALGLVVGVWTVRYLGPTDFGAFSYAAAFVALLSAAAGLGLDGIVVRELVRDGDDHDETLGTAFVLRFASGLATVLLTAGAIFIIRPTDRLAHALVGVLALAAVFQASDIIELWFQAHVRSVVVVKAKAAPFVVTTLLRVALLFGGASVVAFAWATLAETILAAFFLAWAYHVTVGRLRSWRASWKRAQSLLRDSWPLILSSVVIMVYMRIDQVMLGEMVSDSEVGVYSAAVRLAETWYFIPMAIVPSWLPSIVRAKAQGEAEFHARMQKLYNLMSLCAYAIAVPTTLLAGPIVRILFGAGYERAAPMLVILAWSGIFTNLGVARSAFLTTMNWTRVHFFSVLAGGLANVLLNLVLIPRYGGIGAAVASLVAYWLAAHGACYLYRPLWGTANMMTRSVFLPRI